MYDTDCNNTGGERVLIAGHIKKATPIYQKWQVAVREHKLLKQNSKA